MSLEVHAPVLLGSQYKKPNAPHRALIALNGEMEVVVTVPFDWILEVYWAIFDQEGISPQLTWQINCDLDDSAFTSWAESTITNSSRLFKF